MALEPELAKGRFKEMTPLAEVGFGHVKDDMNMVADGDALDLRRGGHDRSNITILIRVVGRRRHGSGRGSVA
jgi:hypothetical protein